MPQEAAPLVNRSTQIGFVSGAGAVLVAFGTVLVVTFVSPVLSSPTTLATLLIGGLLTFLFGLAAVVAVFNSLGFHEKSQPLGLPQGSVQAFIALFLILMFFVMSVFLYSNVSTQSRDRTIQGLTAQQVENLQGDQSTEIVAVIPRQVPILEESAGAPTTASNTDGGSADQRTSTSAPQQPTFEQRFDVIVTSTFEQSDVAEEIARQLVTTIGTLIVAISAFYFGAKTVEEQRTYLSSGQSDEASAEVMSEAM